jgi:hypothetical protein
MSHRTQIILEDHQYERLLAESRRSGVGMGELVRRAVDRMYGAHGSDDVLRALDDSFGGWSGRDPVEADDGASYVERLRRGLASRLAES